MIQLKNVQFNHVQYGSLVLLHFIKVAFSFILNDSAWLYIEIWNRKFIIIDTILT